MSLLYASIIYTVDRNVPKWQKLGKGRRFFRKFLKNFGYYRDFLKIFKKFLKNFVNHRAKKKQNFRRLGGSHTSPTPTVGTPLTVDFNSLNAVGRFFSLLR